MEKEIKIFDVQNNGLIKTIKPIPLHEMAISCVCDYFGTTKDELFRKSKNTNSSYQKHLAFFILKKDCNISSNGISKLCNTTRQYVCQAINKIEVEYEIYLRTCCDYRNIAAKIGHCKKEQDEWLEQYLKWSSMKP